MRYRCRQSRGGRRGCEPSAAVPHTAKGNGAVPRIDWDTEDPPTEPPLGADPLIWRLALNLRNDHTSYDAGGRCLACRGRWPCRQRIVAEQGLVMAALRPGPLGPYR